MRNLNLLSPLALGVLLGCPGAGPSPGQMARRVSETMSHGQPGYELAMQAVGCWTGALWAEAEGYLPPERRAVTEVRCREVLRKAFGDGQARYQAMRRIDPTLVDELARRAAEGAPGLPVADLLRLVADAEREEQAARRAGARCRHDLNDAEEVQHLDADELQVLAQLRASEALGRLLKAELGPLTDDARVLGLLIAVDRVEIVRALPRHLRPFAVEGVGKLLFGIDLPPEVEDPSKQLPRGAWVQHLAAVAAAAGYPVPDSIDRPFQRGLVAFGGILKALADRIRQEEAKLSKDAAPTLRKIADAVVRRLDQDYEAARRVASLDAGVRGGQPSRSTNRENAAQ